VTDGQQASWPSYYHEFVLVGIELLIVLKLLVERRELRIAFDACASDAGGRDGAGGIDFAVAIAVETVSSMDTTLQACEAVQTVMK